MLSTGIGLPRFLCICRVQSLNCDDNNVLFEYVYHQEPSILLVPSILEWSWRNYICLNKFQIDEVKHEVGGHTGVGEQDVKEISLVVSLEPYGSLYIPHINGEMYKKHDNIILEANEFARRIISMWVHF